MIPLEGVGISVLLCYFWITSAIVILAAHSILTLKYDQIPIFLKDLYLYGKLKTLYGKHQQKAIFSVPKRCFYHFYGIGIVVHSFVLLLTLLQMSGVYFPWDELMKLVPISQSAMEIQKDKKWLSPLVVLSMEWFQLARRLYECLFISSFSNSAMSVVHYFYGVFLYASFGMGLLLTVDLHSFSKVYAEKSEVMLCLLGILLFAVASFYQHKAIITFANLRIDNKDNPKMDHFIPKGHLFEWISSPHYLCEIVIYTSFSLTFGMANLYLNSVLMTVVVTQLCSALMNHSWYKKNFSSYPPYRKAILPYIW